MKILQTPNFKKRLKNLHPNQKTSLDEAVRTLCHDPLIGNLKKGDLSGVRVYKFQMGSLMTLLAYQYDKQNDTLTLLKIGSHENFYRDLKDRLIREL